MKKPSVMLAKVLAICCCRFFSSFLMMLSMLRMVITAVFGTPPSRSLTVMLVMHHSSVLSGEFLRYWHSTESFSSRAVRRFSRDRNSRTRSSPWGRILPVPKCRFTRAP